MHRLPLLLLALLGPLGSALAAEPAPEPGLRLYVATGGSDQWSGKLPEPNAARTDGPFATLEGARDAIRELKKAGPLPAGGVSVQVRGGTYERAGQFRLGAEDAGTETSPIVYRAQPGERVILTGARAVSGFEPYRGQILKADVAAQGLKGIAFRQLFFHGRRQQLARYPNFDPQNPHGGGFAYVDGEPLSMYRDLPTEELRVIHCQRKDVRTWAHPEQAEVILFPRYNWINMAVPVTAADPASGTITLGKDIAWGGFKGIRPLDRYYVRNLLEELDAPGEWYLDKEAGTLYFWPPGPIEPGSVRAPVVDGLVEFGPGTAWVTLRGFTLEGCEGHAVLLRDAEHCLIAGNTIHDTGGRLGYTGGVTVQGGHDCGVVGNDLYEICNYGIRLDSSAADVAALRPTGHYADNNYLHDIGVLNGHGCGIYLNGIGLRASHNLIHDTTRCGIFGGGTDCVVEYNHIRHVNLETEDTGGYYTGAAWHVRGLVVRYNYIHDVLGYGRTGDRWTSPHFAWGIYLDDDLSGAHVYGNIVARTTLGGSHIHAGRDNLLENNIFVDNTNQQMQFSGHDPASWVVTMHREEFRKAMARPAWQQRYPELAAANLETVWQMAGNQFRRNIVCYRGPKSLLYQLSANDVPEQNQFDENVIWHYGQPIGVNMKGLPADNAWAEWQKRGFDVHSVIADPRFVDAEHDDYRLQPDSPALKLGFKPIPVDRIGPYASELRATWPIVEARGVREVPLVETRVALPAKPVRTPPTARVLRGWPAGAVTVKLAEAPDGDPVRTPACEAKLGSDGTALHVVLTVPLKDPAKLKRGERWGEDDAAEVCLRDLSGAAPGPIFVSHGFASGQQACVTEAGAAADATARLSQAIRFAATVGPASWTGEWTIPLAAAGITWRPGLKLGFNLGVRRTETAEWLQWYGTGSTWNLGQAGSLVLE